jgi:imidazolonepropionase-like amidohydrolase
VNLVLRAGCLLPLAFVACTTVTGQNRQPAQNDSRPTLFRGARVVVGDGRVIEDGAVLVQNGVLFEVGAAADVVSPRGTAVVNVSGKTVVPAIVNAHTHLGWEKYTSWGSGNFTRDNLIDHLYRHAYYGVGTVISTASDRESIGLPVALDQKLGKVGGARYVPEPGLGTPGGGANPNFTSDQGWWGPGDGFYEPKSPADARNAVRAEAAKGIQVFKIWVDARDEQRGGRIKLNEEIYRAAIDEAIVHDIKVLAHAPDVRDHKLLLRAGVRRIIHGPSEIDDDWIALMKERNAYLIPTTLSWTRDRRYYDDPFFREQVSASVIARLSDPRNLGPIGRAQPPPAAAAAPPPATPQAGQQAAADERARLRFTRMVEAGIQIILGSDVGWGPTATHVGSFFGYAEHLELEAFVRLGMTPAQALAAGTIRPAEAFGLHDVGSIEPGKAADFLVLDANPLDDIRNLRKINKVYLRGAEVDRAALRAQWTK